MDWIQLPHWPVFNVADSAIVCGGVLAVLLAARGFRLDGTRESSPAGGTGRRRVWRSGARRSGGQDDGRLTGQPRSRAAGWGQAHERGSAAGDSRA